VVQRITSKAFQENKELEPVGRIAQLMSCWMKAFELEKLAGTEGRLGFWSRPSDEPIQLSFLVGSISLNQITKRSSPGLQ
jgi:hypothetical protein